MCMLSTHLRESISCLPSVTLTCNITYYKYYYKLQGAALRDHVPLPVRALSTSQQQCRYCQMTLDLGHIHHTHHDCPLSSPRPLLLSSSAHIIEPNPFHPSFLPLPSVPFTPCHPSLLPPSTGPIGEADQLRRYVMPLRDLCPSLFAVLAGAVTVPTGINYDRKDEEDVSVSHVITVESALPSPQRDDYTLNVG